MSSQEARILLVDDDPGQLRVRELILRNAGFVTYAVTSAESALALLAEIPETVRAVVTDHILPGASGAQMARQLRHRWPDLPVIVLTGMPSVEDEYDGLEVEILTKPCNPEDLIALLHSKTDRD